MMMMNRSRSHIAVLTTRNKTLRMRKRSKVAQTSFKTCTFEVFIPQTLK